MCSFSPSNVNIRNTFRKNWNIFWMGGFVKWLSTHLTWKKIKFVFLLVFFKSSVLNVLCQDETIDMDCKKMRRCYTSLRTLFLLVPSSNGFILTGNFYHHICLISKGNFNSLLTIYFSITSYQIRLSHFGLHSSIHNDILTGKIYFYSWNICWEILDSKFHIVSQYRDAKVCVCIVVNNSILVFLRSFASVQPKKRGE